MNSTHNVLKILIRELATSSKYGIWNSFGCTLENKEGVLFSLAFYFFKQELQHFSLLKYIFYYSGKDKILVNSWRCILIWLQNISLTQTW